MDKNDLEKLSKQINREYYGWACEVRLNLEKLEIELDEIDAEEIIDEPKEEEIIPIPVVKKEPVVPWIPDADTYQQIQHLIEFVDLVSELKETSEESRKNAAEVKNLIKNIDKPETRKDFCVTLDLEDWDKQFNRDESEGVFRRNWWVCFDDQRLMVDIESYRLENGEFISDYDYLELICFYDIGSEQKKQITEGIDRFVNDAKKFRSYMSKTMNIIETEIYIF